MSAEDVGLDERQLEACGVGEALAHIHALAEHGGAFVSAVAIVARHLHSLADQLCGDDRALIDDSAIILFSAADRYAARLVNTPRVDVSDGPRVREALRELSRLKGRR